MEKITIDGSRVYLRKITIEDIDDNFMTWFSDEELMRYYTNTKKVITKENIIENIQEGEKNGTSFTYGIFYAENDKVIGTIKLGPINLTHKISDLVVLVGDRNYHGKGLAVEAIRLGNKMAFEKYDMRKLFGGMFESNISSIKAYTRADWVVEGRLKGHYLVDGKAEDRIVVGCFNPKYFKE